MLIIIYSFSTSRHTPGIFVPLIIHSIDNGDLSQDVKQDMMPLGCSFLTSGLHWFGGGSAKSNFVLKTLYRQENVQIKTYLNFVNLQY